MSWIPLDTPDIDLPSRVPQQNLIHYTGSLMRIEVSFHLLLKASNLFLCAMATPCVKPPLFIKWKD